MALFQGTLHVGNMCNNNYKLYKALRSEGVNAQFVNFERITQKNAISDPATIDPSFNTKDPWIHNIGIVSDSVAIQQAYELFSLGRLIKELKNQYWIHAQTDYPLYVSLFCTNYSAHSTGSDLRVDYHKKDIRSQFLSRAYGRAKVVYYNNIDLFDHVLSEKGSDLVFLPNIVDPLHYHVRETPKQANSQFGKLRVLMPSRITFFGEKDIKGNRLLLEALRQLNGLEMTLVLAADDPESSRWVDLIAGNCDGVTCEIIPMWSCRENYLREIIKSDFVVDQFYLGAMGGISMDCFMLNKVALVHLDPVATRCCYEEDFPLPPLANSQAIKDQILRLQHVEYRLSLSEKLHQFQRKYHIPQRVVGRFLKQLNNRGVHIESSL